MSLYYQNTKGLRTKCNDFYLNLLNSHHDIICLTETWLNNSVNSSELFSSEYFVYRRDRESSASIKSDGGGSLIAVNENFVSYSIRRNDWESDVEDVWITIVARNTRINICCVYLPSYLNIDILEKFYDKLQSIFSSNPYDKYLIVGDFNLSDHINQINNSTIVSSLKKVNFLIDTMNLCNFKQFNNVRNSFGGILDLALSNIDLKITNGIDVPLVPSETYHPPLLINMLKFHQRINVENSTYFNFYGANYELINEKIYAIDWVNALNVSDVNECVDIFYIKIKDIINEVVQKKIKRFSRFPGWYNVATVRAYKTKKKLHNKWKISKNSIDYRMYSIARSNLKAVIKQDYINHINNVEQNICSNVKYFWKFIKSKRGSNAPSIPPVVKYNSIQSQNYKECVDLFANYFQSVYSDVRNVSSTIRSNNNSPSELVIEQSEIQKRLETIDCSKSAGFDEIPPIFLKNTSSSISNPVFIIFSKSILQGVFPLSWKETFVSPIFKKGDATDVTNYRPISKLSCLAKLFEKLITEYLYDKFGSSIILEQHGFMKGRSTASNLLCLTEHVIKAMDSKKQVDVVYTDLAKAFDKVDHDMLLEKLDHMGIGGRLLLWIDSYLKNRSLRVVINGELSRAYIPTSGVPQGSHIGPFLFLLYINDIAQHINYSNFLLYADDLKIFKTIGSPSDSEKFQRDLNSICNYFDSIFIPINIAKCVCMRFTKNITNRFDNFYHLNSNYLTFLESYDDLGVVFDTKLTFKPHFSKIVSKAYRMLGFLFRSSKSFKSINSHLLLYNSLVRSQLEYCVQIWNPYYTSHVNYIERVQKRFLIYMFRKNLLSNKPPIYSYSWTITKLGLITLEKRRKFLELIFLFKSIHGIIDSSSYALGYSFFSARTHNTRNNNTFFYSTARTNLGANSPFYRIMKFYNENFNREILMSPNFFSFRTYILNFLSH